MLPLASVHSEEEKPREKKKALADRGAPPVSSQKRPRGRRGAAVYAGRFEGKGPRWAGLLWPEEKKGKACPFWKKKRAAGKKKERVLGHC